ncbi:anion transporter [Solitalea longa]|uniref:Anion transporter n=1 Tax=Solitalea longa TaxID=2079460 RepID=A0A2S5A8U1_9SPHI|nr:DASS family sodium-coupled anion symporter [Solitalea longa]POY38975.1 anion transporter [Solitalea longa]
MTSIPSLLKLSPRYIYLIMGPLAFLLIGYANIIPVDHTIQKVLGIAFWIILWWVTEAIPMPVTSLFPLVLFPLFGVLDLNTASANYANQTVFLFMAGFIFALAIEKHKLHIRIALHIVKFIGTDCDKLILGFMIATFFVSMWISNSAAALLMFPVATSVLFLLEEEFVQLKLEHEFKNFAISLLLGLAFSATVGGISTIIGTPVNIVFTGYLKQSYNIDMTFMEWFVIGFPLAVLLLISAYFVIVKLLFRVKIKSLPGANRIIEEKIGDLGPTSYQEYAVVTAFVLTALGWIIRTPVATFFKIDFLNDTSIGMIGALLLFIIPDKSAKKGFLFDWESMDKFPWGILMMIGGGLALAKAFEVSGVIKLIGETISSSGVGNYLVLIIVLVGIMVILKLFVTTNTALATIAIPMVFGIANAIHIPPLLLGFPVAIAISYAFILPMSTPPNAIVFTTGQVKIKDMVVAGLIMTTIGFVLLIATFSIYRNLI